MPDRRPPVDSPQLALDITWDEGARFDAYCRAGNEAIVAAVEALATGVDAGPLFLFGPGASGKSHLLQAACRSAGGRGAAAVYLPLAQLREYPAELLRGMESSDLVAVDDVHCLAGDRDWEEGLFHLFNAVREGGGRFLAAARRRPDALDLELADLASRLAWGPVYRLAELADADKRRALAARAEARGLVVPVEVMDYLLAHYPRDAAFLFAAMDRLDTASLRAQRRLTIPFVKSVLGPPGAAR